MAYRRGAKTRTSVRMEDLPQGAIPMAPLLHESKIPPYPTVILQAQQNMSRFENCVLLTRVGSFYEIYFDQADKYGPLLNLKVAQKRTNAGSVSMAGFPYFQLDRFLKILVQDLDQYVAIAEAFPKDLTDGVKAGEPIHDRKVSRIVTPGTLVDEHFIDPFSNNYVLVIHVPEDGAHQGGSVLEISSGNATCSPRVADMLLGVAWADLSTGHFYTQQTTLSHLQSLLARIGPREIVLDRRFKDEPDFGISTVLASNCHVTYTPPAPPISVKDWAPMLESDVPNATADALTPQEVCAGNMLLHYVDARLQGVSLKLRPPLRYESMGVLTIDKNSMRALEIRETLRDGYGKGSLLHSVRRTVTKGGARLLCDRLASPSTSISIIEERLDLVTCLLKDFNLRSKLTSLLRQSHDSQRLIQKFTLGKGEPDDMLSLASTIAVTEDIARLLNSMESQIADRPVGCLLRLAAQIEVEEPRRLAARINDAIDEDGIMQQHRIEEEEAGEMIALAEEVALTDGSAKEVASVRNKRRKKPSSIRDHFPDETDAWTMKPTASIALQKQHRHLTELFHEKAELGTRLRDQLGATSLTLRWTPGLGHICHVKGKDTRHLTEVRSVSSSKSTRSFSNADWTGLGQRIIQCQAGIRAEEQRVFRELRQDVVANLVGLRRSAAVLDELDVACSFAALAGERGWCRPALHGGTTHRILGGRHPTVENGLRSQGRSFVRNDCVVGDGELLWLVTGPNMAGKSTFLRQNALITILAQVGSYVPAEYAEIGIVDQIFSRVGSADNLFQDQSTFMVEMLETAAILRQATPRSFVIMDEIGRGTTPEDGTAVAFACLHHLYHVNQCRTLFATHFHSLAKLSEGMEQVGHYCTDILEEDRGFSFVHKLRKGVNTKSHALKVARLAGIPEAALHIASATLEKGSVA